jgi:hypothetical protein
LASFVKLPSGSWRAVVRRKSRYISETFRRKDDARACALDAERQIDRGEAPKASRTAKLRTFGDLIDLHIEDIKEVGRAPGRSKDAALAMRHVPSTKGLYLALQTGRGADPERTVQNPLQPRLHRLPT